MADRSRTLAGGVVLLLFVVGLIAAHGSRGRVTVVQHVRVEGQISPAERAATFTFAPGTSDYDRQAVLTAVAHARPEARKLVDDVDGLVDLRIDDPGDHAVGTTQQIGDRFEVVLNLGTAARVAGQRGIDRLVLHELGHVVDFALVPDALVAQLDAQVPTRYGCTDGVTGACTTNTEIFAESFAKWATGDIGINLNLGYAVPPPPDLEAWGRPLTHLPGA
jgi:hypothetical protein